MQETLQDNRSITRVLHGIVNNIETLVESQMGLAKAELREVMRDGTRAAVPLGIGVGLGQVAIGLLLLAAVSALATRYPLWLSALAVAACTGILALVLIAKGRRHVALVGQSPDTAPPRREGASDG